MLLRSIFMLTYSKIIIICTSAEEDPNSYLHVCPSNMPLLVEWNLTVPPPPFVIATQKYQINTVPTLTVA